MLVAASPGTNPIGTAGAWSTVSDENWEVTAVRRHVGGKVRDAMDAAPSDIVLIEHFSECGGFQTPPNEQRYCRVLGLWAGQSLHQLRQPTRVENRPVRVNAIKFEPLRMGTTRHCA